MLRAGEFLLILYGILIPLTIIKRYRLNHWITQYTEGKEAYTVHQQMQSPHSNGWALRYFHACAYAGLLVLV